MLKDRKSRNRKMMIEQNVWFIAEHYYYVSDRAAPELEYSVYQGKVKGCRYHVSGRVEVRIEYRYEEGYIKLAYITMDKSKPKIFDNPRERDAALLAKENTETYMKRCECVWSMRQEAPSMRQLWEKYLRL